jgi:hypothetical protein
MSDPSIPVDPEAEAATDELTDGQSEAVSGGYVIDYGLLNSGG